MSETPEKNRGRRKSRTGTVVSAKMRKTIVVETVSRVPHPRFGKIVKQSQKFYAHDEEGKAREGDLVTIVECRPLSKLKRWRLASVDRAAVAAPTLADEVAAGA